MSPPAGERARRFVISGRVQGVAFRYFTCGVARQLGLVGWVKNLPTGEVEVRTRGSAADLEAFERQLRQGPSGSRVDSLTQAELGAPGEWSDFRIVY